MIPVDANDHDLVVVSASMSKIEGLPDEVALAAARGWQLFRIDPTARWAQLFDVVARMDRASSDINLLTAEFAENPGANVGVIVGAESGIFVVEIHADAGALAGCFRDAICGIEEDDYRWCTLNWHAAGVVYAAFQWPDGGVSRGRKQLAPGILLHVDGWQLVPPSAYSTSGEKFTYFDPEAPVREAPALLAEMAFG